VGNHTVCNFHRGSFGLAVIGCRPVISTNGGLDVEVLEDSGTALACVVCGAMRAGINGSHVTGGITFFCRRFPRDVVPGRPPLGG